MFNCQHIQCGEHVSEKLTIQKPYLKHITWGRLDNNIRLLEQGLSHFNHSWLGDTWMWLEPQFNRIKSTSSECGSVCPLSLWSGNTRSLQSNHTSVQICQDALKHSGWTGSQNFHTHTLANQLARDKPSAIHQSYTVSVTHSHIYMLTCKKICALGRDRLWDEVSKRQREQVRQRESNW